MAIVDPNLPVDPRLVIAVAGGFLALVVLFGLVRFGISVAKRLALALIVAGVVGAGLTFLFSQPPQVSGLAAAGAFVLTVLLARI